MKTIVDLLLFASAVGSVFFVAGLANVPARVRYTVFLIPPSFFLTFLLHMRWGKHLDFGLIAIGVSIVASALIGFQFIHETPLSKDVRKQLLKRFITICSLSALSAGVVTGLILTTQNEVSGQSNTSISVPQAKPVVPADSTTQAIDNFFKAK
ncbi:hypothetical protein GCM10028805_22370 [Spirosoma harenae]